MRIIPMATVVGNTIRVRVGWTSWDSGTPATVTDPTVVCRFKGQVVATLAMTESAVPGLFEAFWTPAMVGVYDLHASGVVDGYPEVAHQSVTVRA